MDEISTQSYSMVGDGRRKNVSGSNGGIITERVLDG